MTIWNEAVAGLEGVVGFRRARTNIESGPLASAPGEVVDMPAVTLHTVVGRGGGSVSLLKVDVEGTEADIFEAAAHDLGFIREIIGEHHEGIVPDVVERLERSLRPTHQLRISTERRCGLMVHAVLRARR